MAFLLTWISKFLSCNISKKVTKVYLSMVIALALKAKVSLGTFVLSHIYTRMNDLTSFENKKLNGTTRGPIWIVQLWLGAYYIDVCNWKSSIHIPLSELYGPLIAKAKSFIKFFLEFFSYFYFIPSTKCDDYPLYPSVIGPTWVKEMFNTNNITINLALPMWKSILTARDLIYSPMLDVSKNNYCTRKMYWPHVASK